MWFMHHGYDWGWGWGWMAFGMAWMVIFWGGIIALAVWAVSRLTGDREKGGDRRRLEGPSPLDIAKERYARGEITREQFEQLRHDLS
jgi:putative membrane protein